MKGGYNYANKTTIDFSDSNVYNFKEWDLIDIFIYFSHCIVIIPRKQKQIQKNKYKTKINSKSKQKQTKTQTNQF